ncbi:reverse transcriptase domain-containing protein [Tanacetum coccineum]
MTHLLEKETPFIFSKECIEAFETLKMKLTQAPILVAPDWDLPFEIMCDASDFAVGAVLGQLPLAKQDAKSKMAPWIFPAPRIDVVIRDKKGAENHAADHHFLHIENPSPSKLELEKRKLQKHFLSRHLGCYFSCDYNSPCLPILQLPCGDFGIKGMSSQAENKVNQDVKHYFWDEPLLD